MSEAIKRLKALNQQQPFAKQFYQKYGIPKWDYAEDNFATKPNLQYRDSTQDTIITVPIARDEAKYVSDLFYIKMDGNMFFKMFEAGNYENYPFMDFAQQTTTTETAEKMFAQIMKYQSRIFNTSFYKIMDNRLFNNWPDSVQKPNSFYIKSKLVSQQPGESSFCGQIIITVITTSEQTGGELTGVEPGHTYPYNTTEVETVQTFYIDLPCGGGSTEPGGSWEPNIPGGGGGGSWNPQWQPTNPPPPLFPCEDTKGWEPLIKNPDGSFSGGCSDSLYLETDRNGYYFERLKELKEHLQQDPSALLPCETVALLQTWGPMWQSVATSQINPIAQNRLDEFRKNSQYTLYSFSQQHLEDANGPSVNMDFFPLIINQFPQNPNTGANYTANEFLEFFRLNLESFITSPVTTSFSCVFNNNFSDCSHWTLPGEEALGSMLHFHIPVFLGGAISDDGTVMLGNIKSEIFQNGVHHTYFQFVTVASPYDFSHPVAGTRQFGLYNSPEHPNVYTWYTMGVDRVVNFLQNTVNIEKPTFDGADALWNNIKSNLVLQINNPNNFGQAVNAQNVIARPKWIEVEKYLRKQISWEELKILTGC